MHHKGLVHSKSKILLSFIHSQVVQLYSFWSPMTTWGWVNDDRILFFGWTMPLIPGGNRACLLKDEQKRGKTHLHHWMLWMFLSLQTALRLECHTLWPTNSESYIMSTVLQNDDDYNSLQNYANHYTMKETNTFIQQGCIILTKTDSKDLHNVTKGVYFKSAC